jgi:hypothetical protein
MRIVKEMRRHYVEDYLKHLDWIGIQHRALLAPNYKMALEEGA